ncbi:hypothetical protein BDW66DRAFT_127507 [Aspergillus desertorum]
MNTQKFSRSWHLSLLSGLLKASQSGQPVRWLHCFWSPYPPSFHLFIEHPFSPSLPAPHWFMPLQRRSPSRFPLPTTSHFSPSKWESASTLVDCCRLRRSAPSTTPSSRLAVMTLSC